MPNRTQHQDSPGKSPKNPGTFSPDDDEAQEAEVTPATDMPQRAGQEQSQGKRKQEVEPDPPLELEDEEAEDDEDDADGLGARP
ncbi:MAG: hypothetical protein ABI769_19550 [Pseudomonadota bacterium]